MTFSKVLLFCVLALAAFALVLGDDARDGVTAGSVAADDNEGGFDDEVLPDSKGSADDDFEEPYTEAKPGVKIPPRPRVSGFGLHKKENFYWEFLAILLLVVFLANYFEGRRKNENIAAAWASTFFELYEKNFSRPAADMSGGKIVRESDNEYSLYSTGRNFCHSVTTTIELAKRQDLWMAIFSLVSPTVDRVTIDVTMTEEDMDSFVFAVVRKKAEKQLRKKYTDLGLYPNALHPASLPADFPSSLTVLTDAPEVTSELLSSQAVHALTKSPYFYMMMFTDQDAVRKWKKVLRFVFELPPNDKMAELGLLMRMAMFYIDRVGETKLSVQARGKAEKARALAVEAELKAKHQERQEAAQRRKLDKKKQEDEEKERVLASLSPAELRKREAKEQRQALKRKAPKVKLQRIG